MKGVSAILRAPAGMRVVALMLGFLLASAMVLATASGAQARQQAVGSLPVTGELEDGGTFEGTISNLDASVNDAGQLVVSGVLNGTATTADGETREINGQQFDTTAQVQPGDACDILSLDLGPIFLDLLGLTVDLSPITLDVNAVPGAGNLLGNLLCAITGLLDNPGNPTNAIANLLDRIFDLLG